MVRIAHSTRCRARAPRDADQRSLPIRPTPVRILAILATAAIGVLAFGSASASAQRPTSLAFVQSSTGGSVQDGRLTLRGVGRSVSWVTNGFDRWSGKTSLAAMRRVLFSRGRPAPTATLAVGGRRVVALKLSQPRFSPRLRTVGYRVRRQGKRRLPGRFGRASLMIIAPRRLSGNPPSLGGAPGSRFGGFFQSITCTTTFTNNTPYPLDFTQATKFVTDQWIPPSPPPDPNTQPTIIAPGGSFTWSSRGGYDRGCGNSTYWQPSPPGGGQVPLYEFDTQVDWGGLPLVADCKVIDDPTGGTYGCTKVSSKVTVNKGNDTEVFSLVWSVTKTPG